jgi:AraC-like DNA-binding protein
MSMSADIAAIRQLGFLKTAEPLFDALPDVVFFVKDAEARYVAVNQTLVRRCGAGGKDELLGKTVLEVFPAPMAARYNEQDQTVIRKGVALRDLLELHLYVQGAPGWCITTKLPLRDENDSVIGLVGISNDVHAPATQDSGYEELSRAVQHIQANLSSPLRMEALATLCGLSVYQFEQRMKRVFQLTAGQFISKTRIDTACGMLGRTSAPIADIALSCGFSDQSAFTRQFKATTGLTPTEYRRPPAN